MNEIRYDANNTRGLMDGYVNAREAQLVRINKQVMELYATDVKHYKEGADMMRPEPPQLFDIDEVQIKAAFQKYEGDLMLFITGETAKLPTLNDVIGTSPAKDALEGYERPKPEAAADAINGKTGKKGKG